VGRARRGQAKGRCQGFQRAAQIAQLSDAERGHLAALGADPNSDEFALEVGDEAAKLGRKPSELPFTKVGVASNAGKFHQPLDDMSPINDRYATGNVREVTRAQQNFREAQALHRQQLLAELAQQEQEAAQQQAPAEQQQAPQPQPEPAQPAQADPAQVERLRLDWEKRITAEMKQMSVAEMEAYLGLNRLEQTWRSIPEVQNPQLARQTYTRDPARWAQVQQAQREYESQKAQLTREFQHHHEARTTRESQIAQHQRAETERAVEAYNRAEDAKFSDRIAKEYPGHKVAAVRPYVLQAMRKAGVDDARITELWRSGALRGVETQMLLWKAGLQEMGEAKARDLASKRVPLPQVQKPSVYRPAGSGSEEAVRSLERQLDNATGDRAVRLATKLQQAKRALAH
jgi:hypothetical protein